MGVRRPAAHRCGSAVLACLAWATACSEFAPEPRQGCAADADCPAGEVCLSEFGGVCHPADSIAPVADLAFELCEPQAGVAPNPDCGFRSELRACDRAVERTHLTNELRLSRTRLSDTVELLGFSTLRLSEPGASPVPEGARIVLTGGSRLQREPAAAEVVVRPPMAPEEPPAAVSVPWPYYHAWDEANAIGPLRTIVAEIVPEKATLAPLFRLLLRHGIDEATVCTRHRDCTPQVCVLTPDGPRCSTTEQCVLDLAGRRAAQSVTSGEDPQGRFTTTVYTYCEDSVWPINARQLSVTAEGPGALPQLSYTYTQRFPLPNDVDPEPAALPGLVCLPDWQSVEATLMLRGPAVPGWGRGHWTCCSTACLPTAADDGQAPVSESGCFGSAGAANARVPPTVRFETNVPAGAVAGWDAIGCLPVDIVEGRAGRFVRRDSTSCIASPCTIRDLGVPAGHDPQRYTLKIEPPAGSMLASQIRTIDLRDPAEPLDIELPPRRLLRGFVRTPEKFCQGDEIACGADGAIVVAERLRMPHEDLANVPGPYYFTAKTFFDPLTQRKGAYVLPVNPGVYVVTVLPTSRTSGGPGPIAVIDLTRASRETTLDLTLGVGVLVTMSMRGFNRDTTLLPLDIGSWKQIPHPAGGFLDLNATTQCYRQPGDRAQGCRIRALIPEGSRVFLSEVDQLRFFAREGHPSCPCPPGNPACS